jgi:spermidine synthase
MAGVTPQHPSTLVGDAPETHALAATSAAPQVSYNAIQTASHTFRRFLLANRNKKNRKAANAATAVTAAAPDAARSAHPPLAVVALLVLASGCAALVFQIAWMRELRLIFGATTAAAAAVLAIFMAGLGIGSALLGKVADRVQNPLRMYGLLEVAIALSAAATPWLISLAGQIYLGLGGQEALGVTSATGIRLLLAAAIMAVPTVLMGGTLPAAVRSVTRVSDLHRRSLGILYGSNTLGAVLGSAVATFFALETLGTRATLMSGCALGFLAGIMAISRSRSLSLPAAEQATASSHTERASQPTPETSRDDAAARSRDRLLYFAAFVLGFTFFALEMVWYRMLGPILGGTAFTFGLILCVALTGIGVGGIAYNFVFSRWRPSWTALAITCVLEGLFTIFSFALGDRLALLAATKAEVAGSFGELIRGWTNITSIVVLPVALVAGIQFPLLIALLGSGRQAVSRHLGTAYAWNTFGAIAGSLVAGFATMRLLTAPGMWQAVGIMLAALAIVIAVVSRQMTRRGAVVLAVLAIATVGLSFAEGPTVVWRHSGIGAGRADMPDTPNQLRRWMREKRRALAWEAEGIESSIGILGDHGYAFVVNGKADGNALEDSPTQIGAAILGAVLHEDPKTALVIGLGTGESAGWLAEMRNMERVDVVELEPAIDEMARLCRELNWDVLNNPRVRRIYNDGREFVFTTKNEYDIIFSEPSNPYRAGVASLYTSEFYEAAKRRLKPGGLFIQWLQAYEVDALTIHTVVATARSVFNHVELWHTLPIDLQLVCSAAPIEYSASDLRKRLEDDVVQLALTNSWKMGDLEGFLAHFVANAQWSDGVEQIQMMPRNTDDRTVLEYSFAKTVGGPTGFSVEKLRAEVQTAGLHRPALAGETVDWNRVEIRRQEFSLLNTAELSINLLPEPHDRALIGAFGSFALEDYKSAVERWPAEHRPPRDGIQRLVLATSYAELGRADCLELLAETDQEFPIETAAVKAIYYWRAGDAATASQWLERYFAMLADNPWVIRIIAEPALLLSIHISKADPAAAQRFYTQLSRPFASRRFHYPRLVTQAMVAEYLGPEAVVEALAKFEPEVPWISRVLESRAKAYKAVNHPLAERAERDVTWYRRQAHADR